MMRIWHFCFILGALSALCGMGLGIAMGIMHDFSLTPVHAHVNLLGWVTMTLYGLYYRGTASPIGWFARLQFGAAALGFPAMTGGLALVLSGAMDRGIGEPLIIVGSLFTIGAMLCFLIILVRGALQERGGKPV